MQKNGLGRTALGSKSADEYGSSLATSVVSLTLLYISRMLKKVLRVTLNEVKGLMYLKRRDSSLRSE